MRPALESPTPSSPSPDPIPAVAADLLVGGGLTLGVAWIAGAVTGAGAGVLLPLTAGLYLGLAGLILRGLPDRLPGRGLGPPNRITLARAALVLPVAAFLVPAASLNTASLWWIVGASTLALTLDGLDGRVARKTGASTSFGARFDMELDAFLLLVLSVLVWQSGQVGPWVILIGALRYLFVVAGQLWPVLRGDLPESFRRKTVCVVQGVALLVALGPIIPGWLAGLSAGVALFLLVYSFGVDTIWLVREGRRTRGRISDP